jgi:hypothetical protein
MERGEYLHPGVIAARAGPAVIVRGEWKWMGLYVAPLNISIS